MKKVIIFLFFLNISSADVFAQEINPDGPIGSIIVTGLGGIHTGNGDVKYQDAERQDVNDLRGYLFAIKLEVPISSGSTFLLLLDYDKIRTFDIESEQQTEYFTSKIKAIVNVKSNKLPKHNLARINLSKFNLNYLKLN